MRVTTLLSIVVLGCGGPKAEEPETVRSRSGLIHLSQSCAGPTCSATALARFWWRDVEPGLLQPLATIGPCTVTRPRLTEPASHDELAGTITVSGMNGGPIQLELKDGYYDYEKFGPRHWSGGETLSVSASGGVIPAFSGVTVVAPSPWQLTSPACRNVECGKVRQSSGFTASWSGGPGVTELTLVSRRRDTFDDMTLVLCRFTGGSGTVPADALAKLGRSSDGYEIHLFVSRPGAATFTAGGFETTFTAVGEIAGGDVIVEP